MLYFGTSKNCNPSPEIEQQWHSLVPCGRFSRVLDAAKAWGFLEWTERVIRMCVFLCGVEKRLEAHPASYFYMVYLVKWLASLLHTAFSLDSGCGVLRRNKSFERKVQYLDNIVIRGLRNHTRGETPGLQTSHSVSVYICSVDLNAGIPVYLCWLTFQPAIIRRAIAWL